MIEHIGYDGNKFNLINTKTRKEVKIGDVVEDFRGDTLVVKGMRAPHKPASSGFAWTDGGEFYVGVIGAQFVLVK